MERERKRIRERQEEHDPKCNNYRAGETLSELGGMLYNVKER